ncbi:MAG: RidA family protein [Bacteroidia bacterium]|nr:RidA family protein [Bacteroidia bacterium]
MSDPTTTKSPRAPEPVGPYPHARRVGNFLFLSGVGPRKRGSKQIPGVTFGPDGSVAAYDIETQCRSMFENVRLILEDAGAKWENIVDVTVFLTDIKKDFDVYNRVYAEYFSRDPKPTRTTLGISALPTPIAVEIKVVAYIE